MRSYCMPQLVVNLPAIKECREDLAKECKQITTFVDNETNAISRVSLRRPAQCGVKSTWAVCCESRTAWFFGGVSYPVASLGKVK